MGQEELQKEICKREMKSLKTFRRVLRINVVNNPDSFLTELMAHFESIVVIKLIRLYSAKTIKIPDVDKIWKVCRDKLIRHRLDIEDTKQRRSVLANYFGLSLPHISAIYAKEKKAFPKAPRIGLDFYPELLSDTDVKKTTGKVVEIFSKKKYLDKKKKEKK